MARGSIFRTNQGQTIQIPKDVALPDSVKHVEIVKLGNSRLIVPVIDSWHDWRDSEKASEDFMEAREQPSALSTS